MHDKTIAFFDLLGTKNLQKSDLETFNANLTNFSNAVTSATTNHMLVDEGQELNGVVQLFSDCCYVEAYSIDLMLKFITDVRFKLFSQGIFFNTAIIYGQLDAKKIGKIGKEKSRQDIINGTYFGKDAVNAYLLQSNLKGIAVSIQDKIASQESNNLIVKSCYFPKERSYESVQYYDLKFDNELLEDEDYYKYFLTLMISSKTISKKYGRYYLPTLITMIKSIDVEKKTSLYNLLINDNIYNELSDLAGGEYVYFTFLNEMYNADSSLTSECEDFISKKRRITNRLEIVPDYVLSPENKLKFAANYAKSKYDLIIKSLKKKS